MAAACAMVLRFLLGLVVLVLVPTEARLGLGATTLTQETFNNFVAKSGQGLMVDFFDPTDLQWREGQKNLEAAVRIVRDAGSNVPVAQVDATIEKELAAKYVPSAQFPQAVWFLHGEATQYHRRLRTSKDLSDFVLALDRDPVMLVDDEEDARNYSPVVFARLSRGSSMLKALEVVASKHMDTVAFAVLDQKRWDGKNGGVFWLANNSAPEAYDGEAASDALDTWVRGHLVHSEPVPVGDLIEDEGSRVVVGKTFEQEVLRPDKDVMLLIYAPWCGFCKKFAPTWRAFAQDVKDVGHLVVAKIDGSRNTSPLPDFIWEAYPKVVFVKAGTNYPVVFNRTRTVEELKKFAEEHGGRPLVAAGDDGTPSSTADL